MADGFAVTMLVEMGLDVVGRNGEVLMEEAKKIGFGLRLLGFCVVLQSEEFDAVAGGENEALADAGLVEKGTGCIGESRGGDSEALANLDWRGVVIDAQENEASLCRRWAHGAVNLWTAEN
jgi:hypothetical protein